LISSKTYIERDRNREKEREKERELVGRLLAKEQTNICGGLLPIYPESNKCTDARVPYIKQWSICITAAHIPYTLAHSR
jgi:hypothetical protein